MNSDGERRRKGPSITSLLAFGLLLFVVYLLLPGLFPHLTAAGIITRGGTLDTVINVVYWPLIWCIENVDGVYSFYQWYSELCGAPGRD